jgi:hypothetical protein
MKPTLIVNGFYVGEWRWEHRGALEIFSKGHRAFLDLTDLARSVEAAIAPIKSSADLTEAGKRKALAEWVKQEAVPKLTYARDAISAARGKAAERRAGLKPTAGDRTDVVGALIRKDIRDHFAKLDPATRIARITTGVDPETALALMEAPPELSGITKEQAASLVSQAILAAHPEVSTEISEMDGAAEDIEAAQRAAMKSISKVVGVPEHELRVMLGEPSGHERLDNILGGLGTA